MHASRRIGVLERVMTETPALAGSLVLAEIAYKFHSFTLELLAFAATWWLARQVSGLVGLTNRRPVAEPHRQDSAARRRLRNSRTVG